MKSVTFSLINWPTGVSADRWVMAFGPALFRPPTDSDWLFPDSAPLNSDLAIQLRDTDRFYRLAILANYSEVGGYISTSAFTFEDGHNYQFDANANTLTDTTPPPVKADWLDSLLSFWAGLANTMAKWAVTAASWVWPLNIVAPLVIGVSAIVDGIFSAMLDFRIFYRALALRVSELLDWDEILDHLSEVLDQVAAVWAWFSEWTDSVWDVISTWWDATYDNVKGWVETKVQGLPEMLAAWGNFFTNTLPTLFDLSYAEEWYKSKLAGVGELIGSAFVERADLWTGWSGLRQAVSDIVTAPFDWLEEKFTDWFLGGEVLRPPPTDNEYWPSPQNTTRSK